MMYRARALQQPKKNSLPPCLANATSNSKNNNNNNNNIIIINIINNYEDTSQIPCSRMQQRPTTE
jgi:hypothetical protein